MPVLFFILLTLFWGGAYLGIHYVVAVYPPFFAAGVRVLIATMCMLPFAWPLMRRAPLDTRTKIRCAVSGLFFVGTGWALLFWGQRHVTPSVASILIAATVILNALLLPVLDRGARVDRGQWAGVLLGFLGVVLVFSPGLRAGSRSHLLGMLAMLGTSLSYAIAACMLQSITRTVRGQVIYVWQGLAAALFLLLLSAVTESWPQVSLIAQSRTANLAMGFLILVPSTLGYLTYFHLVRVWGSVAASAVSFTIPLVTLTLDALVLHQAPDWPVLVGAVIILAGIYQVQTNVRMAVIARSVSDEAIP